MKKDRSLPLADITPQFIKDNNGEEIGVFFPIAEYEGFLDELEDFYLGTLAAATQDREGAKSLDEVKKILRSKQK